MHRIARNSGCGLSAGLVAVVVLSLAATPAAAQELRRIQSMCASCHTDVGIEHDRALAHAPSATCLTCHHIGYSNDPVVAASRRVAACAGCHEALPGTHEVGAEALTCTRCHTIHPDPAVAGADLVPAGTCESCHESRHLLHTAVEDAPSCAECHTLHAGAAAGTALSVAETCETCHEGVHPSHASLEEGLRCTGCHGMDAELTVARVDVLLAEACQDCHEPMRVPHAGDEGEATLCVDCHGFADDPPMALAGAAMSQRCGSCHTDALSSFRSGGHAAVLEGGSRLEDLPTCITCHTGHVVPGRPQANLRLVTTVRCIECHSEPALIEKYGLPENVGASYLDDYHGATAGFLADHPAGENQPRVMVCSDCHGAHAVGWQPEQAMAEVCLGCHEGGDVKLAGAWLGHERIGPENQVAVWAIRVFYYVLIPFVLGGLFLNIVLHLRHERRKGHRLLDTPGVARLRALLSGKSVSKPATVTRFNALERLEHLGAMTTFILLVLTGLPQTAPRSAIGRWFIELFGGIGATRLIHRVAGFTFVALLVMHVARGVVGVVRRRRLPEITPRKQDFLNVLQHVHHYLRGAPKPKTGKFDAAAKFEYWGLFLGGTLMSVTGVVLVFPELVTQFVPGIVVAAMRVLHGLEATFAVLVVLLWHSWGVIFRPEIFPLDTSMFTGKITLRRLREEHELEYERLFPGGAEGD